MKKLHKKHLSALNLLTVLAVLIAFAPSVQALGFNLSDYSLSYLIVTGSPDIVKPGDIVTITVRGMLAVESITSESLNVKFFADTSSTPQEVIMEGTLVLPADATEEARQFSVTIPSTAIHNTWLTMSVGSDWSLYSKITVSQIQNPTYSELKTQNEELQSSNSTLNLLMYTAVFIAIVFIIATIYIMFLTLRANKKKGAIPPSLNP